MHLRICITLSERLLLKQSTNQIFFFFVEQVKKRKFFSIIFGYQHQHFAFSVFKGTTENQNLMKKKKKQSI